MGRAINKKFFGDDAITDNILVYFYSNGSAVPGFIVKQTGSRRFICEETNGNRQLCNLVSKAPGDLNEGEMSIAATWDGNTYYVSKIEQHLVSINGGQIPWSFSTALNPGTAQLPEFGLAPVLYLSTNSYLTFGEGADDYSDLNYNFPELPKIMVDAADNSLQIMYYGAVGSAPNRTYVVRYQGTDETGGDPEDPNMIIEYHFLESDPGKIQIHIVSNDRNGGGYSAIASADTELATFDPAAGNAYEWDDTAQTLTPIALDEHGISGLTEFNLDAASGEEEGPTNEPPYDDWSEDDGFVGFFVPWTVRFNGTDWRA